MLMTWIIYYSPHIFQSSEQRPLDKVLCLLSDRPPSSHNSILKKSEKTICHFLQNSMDSFNLLIFLQVLFFHVFRYTALGLSIPLNTRINNDSSTAFIVNICLQLMEVSVYHLSCVCDTIKGSH